MPIPALDIPDEERAALIEATTRFLAVEREDERDLARIAKELKDVRDTTLWHLVVELMEHDNAKHGRVLRFIHDAAQPTRRRW